MADKFAYDTTDKRSILEYARRLTSSTISQTNADYQTFQGHILYQKHPLEDKTLPLSDSGTNENEEPHREFKGKGSFGQTLETLYFGKEPDSESLPDFQEASVELKASPLKRLQNDEIRVKERLVLNQFRYIDIVKETFETSHLLVKDSIILLVFYFYDKLQKAENLKIDLVDLWECIKEDEDLIRKDWETIVNKIKQGKAEELSEGDTLLLGACTKGATKATSLQKQPFSNILAPSRALCFKSSYINHIYKVLKERNKGIKKQEPRLINTQEKLSLDDTLKRLLNPYIGKTGKQLEQELDLHFSEKYKSRYADIGRKMLGFKKKEDSFYEMSIANIQIKSIRVETNGRIKESMSFRNIYYKDIVDEEWEDSLFYEELVSKFIFMVFKHCKDTEDYYFAGHLLWNMPESDISEAQKVWEDTKTKIIEGDYNHFTKISDNNVSHVRPKAQNVHDTMETPQGTQEKKKCFWLNRCYIEKILKDF